jgi:3-oxoadipate enol-lactonase
MDGFVNTDSGRIHYLEHGTGVPLVLMHSNGASAHEFQDNVEGLAKNFRVIAWDMPGHGDSDGLTGHMTIGAYSDALNAFLKAIDVDRAIVGGSSVGAVIAADFASRYPGRVRMAVLIELASRPESWWAEHWPMVELMFSIPAQTAEAAAKRLVRTPSEKILRRSNIDRHKAGSRAMMDVMWAGREYDVALALPRIVAPTLLVFGDKSPLIEQAAVLQRSLAAGKLSILRNAGHFPMIDVPEEFNRVITEFALDNSTRV